MAVPLLVTFAAGATGAWRIAAMDCIGGDSLPMAGRLAVIEGRDTPPPAHSDWVLRGITSNERYVLREEKNELLSKQQRLGRAEATCAALIPLRKNAAWWALTQDERRAIFEAQSHHTQIGMRYLPAIARKLHHCRDLSEDEPFDFLTWFEFAPAHEPAFDQLLAALRATREWQYVEREVDLRLVRES